MSVSLLHNELKKREREQESIKVGLAGTGFMGLDLLHQIQYIPGLEVGAVLTRRPDMIAPILGKGGQKAVFCRNKREIQWAIKKGQVILFTNPQLSGEISLDIMVDCTGHVPLGLELARNALEARQHFIANPEMDATLGPIVHTLFSRQGLIYTGAAGDEPGVILDLYHHVSLMGFEVLVAGKFKQYLNVLSTPTTVKDYARQQNQNPYRLSSFADGTKMSMEMAMVCNSLGLQPDTRGMHCPWGTLTTVLNLMRVQEEGGILKNWRTVEVIMGVQPSGGVFIVASGKHHRIRNTMAYLKMGPGPYYLFYHPYHLCALEIPLSIARAVLLGEATVAPEKGLWAEVITMAKKNMVPGDILDPIGGYTSYGVIEKVEVAQREDLLPIGLSPGLALVESVKQHEPIPLTAISPPRDCPLWPLYGEQQKLYLPGRV